MNWVSERLSIQVEGFSVLSYKIRFLVYEHTLRVRACKRNRILHAGQPHNFRFIEYGFDPACGGIC